jgi:hypothetical protein
MSASEQVDWELQAEDLATFQSFDGATRSLVLRLCGQYGDPTEADFKALGDHPQSQMLANWLLTLPTYRATRLDDEEDDS